MATVKRKKTCVAEDILTPKQEAFCRHYVDIGNAFEAYRLSYNTENMKWDTIRHSANELQRSPKITLRIQELQREDAENSKLDRKKVERVLLDIVNVDPADIYYLDKETGKLRTKAPSQLPKRVRQALQRIENNRGVVKYGFNSKAEAARLLAAWNGWNAPTQLNIGGNTKHELRIGYDEDINEEE